MKFEIGKFYRFPRGGKNRVMKIVGVVASEFHGLCLVGEEWGGLLSPVGAEDVLSFGCEECSGFDDFVDVPLPANNGGAQ